MKSNLILIAIFTMVPTFAHAEGIATDARENLRMMEAPLTTDDPDIDYDSCPTDNCRAEANRPTFNGRELPFSCSFSKSFLKAGSGRTWPNIDLEAISSSAMAMDDEDEISYSAEFIPGTSMTKLHGQPLTQGNRIKLTITRGLAPPVTKYINAQPGTGGSVTMGHDASYEGKLGTMKHTLFCNTY